MVLRVVNFHKIRFAILAVVLVLFGLLGGCVNVSSLRKGTINITAVSIPSEYGRVEEVWAPAGPIDRAVIIFGERHDLIKARENITRMLEYLHQKYQISFIGLEATPFTKGGLDTSGFRTLPEFENLEDLKKEMAWTLLDDGEINPYEYMGITYGIDVYGVENWDLYRRNLRVSESIDWDALKEERIQLVDWVFSKLRERLFSKLKEGGREGDLEKLNKCLERLLQERAITFEEFLECAAELDSDGFVELKAIWDKITTEGITAGEDLHRYLKKKCIEYGKSLPPNMAKYDQYLQLAEKRGYAMADNLASLVRKPKVKIAVLGIGAAHTEVLKELKQKRIPYIYVIPRGMTATATEWEEQARASRLDATPLPNGIASWLPGDWRLMGQTRVDKRWFRLKVETLYTSLIAAQLKQMGLADEKVEKAINSAFSQAGYERFFTPFWDEMQEISGDLYLPFEIAGKRAVIRVTHDEIAYNVKNEDPILAHGRITAGEFYQFIDYEFWQNGANRQQFINQVLKQRPPESLLDQFRLVYKSIKEGEPPEQVLKKAEAFDSVFVTGSDVYGFYRDETGERHFIRLTEEPFRAWAEPRSHIVKHGPVAKGLRYEVIDLEPFLGSLEEKTKEVLLNDQVFLAKLDGRLRFSAPTILLYNVKVDKQEVHLLVQGEGEETKVVKVEADVNKLLKTIWEREEMMNKDPTFPTTDLVEKLTDEDKKLIKDKLILPLVRHLKVQKSEEDRVVLDLEDEYRDFAILDLPNVPVLRTIVPYFLRGNRLVYVAEGSTARDVERALQIPIDVHKLKVFISKPSYYIGTNWPERVAALKDKADKIGLELTDLTTIAKENPEEAKRALLNALAAKDSLVFAFGHIPSSKDLDLGGGEKSRFTQDEIPKFEKPVPRFVAFVGCKSYATGWPDIVISKNAGEVSFSFWEEFKADKLFEFLSISVDELDELVESPTRPSALRFLLDIAERTHIPGGVIVRLPLDLVKEG